MEEIDFVAKHDSVDDRVYDGTNYAGLMRPKDYVAKREQVKLGEEVWRAQRLQELRARDAQAATKDAKTREDRQRRKKEQLRDELASTGTRAPAGAPASACEAERAKEGCGKRKRSKGGAGKQPKLSFDEDEE
ncbi:hypothetical protein KFE25_004268 [Diacronema lutheri]|uniref:Uncharacterized protein n=2 Tax=Diacronema lutheri TaxID=2081491 RepID=A0A8J6C316_DIALT|nr:hypothetical protein KFE25_004268 [Diacronema lutheri]